MKTRSVTVINFTSKRSGKKYRLEFDGLAVACTCPGYKHRHQCYHTTALSAVLLQRSFPELDTAEAVRLAEVG